MIRTRYRQLLISLLLLSSATLMPAAPRNWLKEFGLLPILDEGRIKPLDSFARQTLQQISGKSHLGDESALQWLARLLFSPETTRDDRMFRLRTDDLVASLVLPQRPDRTFTFNEIAVHFSELQKLAMTASEREGGRTTPGDADAIRIFSGFLAIHRLSASLHWSRPDSALAVTDPNLRVRLGLSKGTPPPSYFDLRHAFSHLGGEIERIRILPPASRSPADQAFLSLGRILMETTEMNRSSPLVVLPGGSVQRTKGVWLSTWDAAVTAALADPVLHEDLVLWRDIRIAIEGQNPTEAASILTRFRKSSLSRMTAIGGRTQALTLEVLYNRANLFFWAMILYGLAMAAVLLHPVTGRSWLYISSTALIGCGFLLHSGGLLLRFLITRRPPVTNMYETFLFVGWIGILIAMAIEWTQKNNLGWISGSFSGLLFLLISRRYAMGGDTMGQLAAVLNTHLWLTVHVLTITIGYAACVVGGIIGHVYLIQRKTGRMPDQTLRETGRTLYATLAFGLLFTTLGTLMGGIWADLSWGRFWGWDPKENGALVIILWLAILFHARLAGRIGTAGMAAGAVISIITVVLAWFGVNLLGVGLHSYGFISEVNKALFIFLFLEILFLVLAMRKVKGKT